MLRPAAQAIAVYHGNADRDEVCLARLKLIAEEIRPAKAGKR